MQRLCVEGGRETDRLREHRGEPPAGDAVQRLGPDVVLGDVQPGDGARAVDELRRLLLERHARDEVVDARRRPAASGPGTGRAAAARGAGTARTRARRGERRFREEPGVRTCDLPEAVNGGLAGVRPRCTDAGSCAAHALSDKAPRPGGGLGTRSGAGRRSYGPTCSSEHGRVNREVGSYQNRAPAPVRRGRPCDRREQLFVMTLGLAGASGAALAAQVQTEVPPVVPGAKPVTVERVKIHGKALEGNLEGRCRRPRRDRVPAAELREGQRRDATRSSTRCTATRSAPSSGPARSTCRRRSKAPSPRAPGR